MAALMTQHATPKTFARAKIFDLLLDHEIDEVSPTPPPYVDAVVADQMIQRALSSFSAPAIAPEMGVQPQVGSEAPREAMLSDMPSLFQSRAPG